MAAVNQAEAEAVTRQLLGISLPPGLEPLECPACGGWWHACRNRAGTDPRHDQLARTMARRLARAAEPGALFPRSAVLGPVLGIQPMSAGEGALADRLARGEPAAGHPSACASQPGCWHAKVRHRHAGTASPCEIPGCPCLDYVSQAVPVRSH